MTIIEDPKPQPYRIATLYAAIVVSEDGEGIFAVPTARGMMPLVFSNKEKLADYEKLIASVCRVTGKKVEIRAFKEVSGE